MQKPRSWKTRSVKTGLISIVIVGVIAFGAIQLIPVARTNPPVVREPNWDSPQTRALAVRACYDCHSNETRWRWYAYVAPVSWLVVHDTEEGRGELNFSEWRASSRKVNEIVQQIRSDKMPKSVYLPLHPEARLTDAEKEALISGLQHSTATGQ